MFRRPIFVLCILTTLAGLADAQGKKVTNADLEKFKEKRVQAERNLKDYYAKNGLTEEDVAKREAADAKAREELSARLRAERLERERIENERSAREASAPQVNVFVPQQQRYDTGYFVYGDRYYPLRGPWNRRFNRGVQWRATPMGIVYEPGSLPSSIWTPRFQSSRPTTAWRTARQPR